MNPLAARSSRLSLRARLLLISLALVAVGLLGAHWFVARALERDLTAHAEQEMLTHARLSAVALRDAAGWSPERASAMTRELAARSRSRVTLIAPDGRVFADSELTPSRLSSLDGHDARPEVRAARERGSGLASRTSGTLQRPLRYAAVRTEGPGGYWVVRVSVSPAIIETTRAATRRMLWVGGLLGLAVAAGMSWLAVTLAARPLRALTASARAMVADLSVRTRLGDDDEVGALAEALDALADNLAASLRSLGRERDRLGAILESMAEGVLVTDATGNVVLANRAVREMFLLGGGVQGRPPIEVLRSAELHELFTDVRAGAPPVTREIAVGGIRPRRVMARVAPVEDPGTGAVALLSDVTELRRLETVRRDFVANVSHELRTPVAAIRTATETLLLGAARRPDTAEEFVGMIDRHAERLHRLVEDLLELSRLEARELRLDLASASLREECARALELMRLAAEARRTRLVNAVPEDIAEVVVDRRALEHVLTNLVDNAIRYCPEGATVTLRASRRGDGVRLTVEDDGPGIEARHLPRLFERCYRVDGSRSRHLGGTGLGLAIVKHLAEAMGAEVSVESAPGRGTRFHVDLRAAEG